MTQITPDIAIILLAAGGSARLGSPKQLVDINGTYLLQHTIDQASLLTANNIILVLGAYHSEILSQIDTKACHVVLNPKWQEGFSSSIKIGLETSWSRYENLEAIILVLCDQPYLTTDILHNIIQTYQRSGAQIVNCRYNSAFGPPTLFHKTMFPNLMKLSGDEGAKMIVQEFKSISAHVDFLKGSIDLDTSKDVEDFRTHLLDGNGD